MIGLGRRNLITFLEAQQRLMVCLRDAIKVWIKHTEALVLNDQKEAILETQAPAS